ncbi:hypothetical protein [Streptomyces sp. NBC_00624]|uniref:hypothetical protein n=1 Tax=Streptomyces sp. NBC_00624 TaxID=2975791 RepID=UPI0030E48FE6
MELDAKTYNAQLADLRALRDDIKKSQATLAKLETDRARRITALAGYEKAKAERIAPAAGLSLADVVAIAPILAPNRLAGNVSAAETAAVPPAPEPAAETAPVNVAEEEPAHAGTVAPAMTRPVSQPASEPEPPSTAPAAALPTAVPQTVPTPPTRTGEQRTLPGIPQGPDGERWFTHAANLASTHPNFTQQARSTVSSTLMRACWSTATRLSAWTCRPPVPPKS